ncbi:Uncharacterised protein [Legionella steigerwaltii]|uniref:Uncharacterized protein n=1 Tax=Legionella steigerwaltii TaxID=460 RepID=A0A378LCK5_9GAMM|nr:hypothetical protein [Legionella steigerwaltii]KTD79519.1 hypothetical protein Lstg_0735 [Legionella steigerwaltii]STY24596.1 Uncharacterised protein [Legionella steigerwaltii]
MHSTIGKKILQFNNLQRERARLYVSNCTNPDLPEHMKLDSAESNIELDEWLNQIFGGNKCPEIE